VISLRSRLGCFLAVLFLATVQPSIADDVGITSARLIELGEGGYALEADISPRMVAALRPPVVPGRFTLAERPTYRRVGVGLVVRYEFGGSEQPLQAGDALLLPWARSAVLLTARWRNGTVQRAMFPRRVVSIPIPIEVLKPVERTAVEVARQHFGLGFERLQWMALRALLALGIVAVAGGTRRAFRLLLVFAGGHALAMVGVDLGVPPQPPELAAAGLGIAAALLAGSALRDEEEVRLWPLILAAGGVDGLGMADVLSVSGLDPGNVVPALFGTLVGIDLALLAFTLFAAVLWRRVPAGRLADGVTVGLGGLAAAGVIAAVSTGFSATAEAGIDPADRMAAARYDLRSGTGAGGGAGRATPPPRRLEESAMIFLTIEPQEVRVEVLLSLQDFLEPLRIDGGPGSVAPPEVQGEIAARARRMVAGTIELAIDGREAVPLLARTDFVSVAATGVTTRREPVPEPLDTAVLGVSLVYGVDRPPSGVTAGWQVFPTPTSVVPAVWTDPTGSERVTLTPEQPVLAWANDLSSFGTPPVEAVAVRAPRWPLSSMVLVGLALAAGVGSVQRRWGGPALAVAVVAVSVAATLYPFVRTEVALPGLAGWAPSRSEAAEIVDGLLTNVYRSFDLRDEESIYDRLEVSVTGDQLAEVYLENRRALELENRGGARARVDEVEILEVPSVRRDGEGGFRVVATWKVSGSVNHFGHVHYRQNRYDAALDLIAVDGSWKIRGIELLDERRLL
jgi:hypothetical protein